MPSEKKSTSILLHIDIMEVTKGARLFRKDVHVINTVQRPLHAANTLAAKAQHPRRTAKIQRMLKQFSHPSTARRPRKPYISGGR